MQKDYDLWKYDLQIFSVMYWTSAENHKIIYFFWPCGVLGAFLLFWLLSQMLCLTESFILRMSPVLFPTITFVCAKLPTEKHLTLLP